MKPAKILLAQEESLLPMMVIALEGYEVVSASTSKRAFQLMADDGIDLFVISVHFDDSRALEFVSAIRECKKHLRTPIVIVRSTPSLIADLLRITILALVKVKAISQYVEVSEGESAPERLRAAVDQSLPAGKAVPRAI
jgi:DNA-binding NarL/FixJ family response regulator